MELTNGKYLLALSDGMGVGKKAAKHSEKTLAMMERLFETGFDSDTTLKIVNSTLLATATEEVFSTLDLALIDTYTGETRFVKSGAPSSFIKNGSKVLKIKGGSLPVGIMEAVSPKTTESKLSPGDMVIMVTDGIVDAFAGTQGGEEVLCKLLSTLKTCNPRELAEEVLNAAKKAGVKDDMTVMVAGVLERA
jgi:stage II sporulation protein E